MRSLKRRQIHGCPGLQRIMSRFTGAAVVWRRRLLVAETNQQIFNFLYRVHIVRNTLVAHPALPRLQSNSSTYAWSIAALLPIILRAIFQIIFYYPHGPERSQSSLTYFPVVVAASSVWLITTLGAKWEYHRAGHPLSVHGKDFELGLWGLLLMWCSPCCSYRC